MKSHEEYKILCTVNVFVMKKKRKGHVRGAPEPTYLHRHENAKNGMPNSYYKQWIWSLAMKINSTSN